MKTTTAYEFQDFKSFITQYGSMIDIDGDKYYHLPFWLINVRGRTWAAYHIENAPKEVQDFIVSARLGGDNPQIKKGDTNGISGKDS